MYLKCYIYFMGIQLYRLMEHLDGEKGKIKIIPYKIAQKIKVYLLNNWIK